MAMSCFVKTITIALSLSFLDTMTLAQSWSKVAQCTGKTSGISFSRSAFEIQTMAQQSSRVKICTKGNSDDCIVSKPNTYPIVNLRQGLMLLSHLGGTQPCDKNCMNHFWEGPTARLNQMATDCGNNANLHQGQLNGSFWGCNTTGTLTYSFLDACNWDWRDGWYDSGIRASCTTGCSDHGLECTEQNLFTHNDDVSSPEKVLDIIRKVDKEPTYTTCRETYPTALDVPVFQDLPPPGACYSSGPGRQRGQFNCNVPVGSYGKRRLCWCSTVGGPPPDRGLEIFIDWASVSPTSSPTKNPTGWFQHPDHHGTNISQLEEQIKILQRSVQQLQVSLQAKADKVNVDKSLKSIDDQFVVVDEEIQKVDDKATGIRSAILSVVDQLPDLTKQPQPSAPSSCPSGLDCKPQILANGNDLSVIARGGNIQIESKVCGKFDPCTSRAAIQNITDALQGLRSV